MRRLLAPLAAAALCPLVLAACGGARASVPTTLAPRTLPASTTSLPAATTTTTAPGTGPVPAVITVQYVDAVLSQLLQVYERAVRMVIEARSIPPTVPPLLRAIYGDEQFNRESDVFSQAVVTGSVNTANVNQASSLQLAVSELLSENASCVEALTEAASSVTGPKTPTWVVLQPKVAADDPNAVNRTPWQLTYQLTTQPSGGEACAR